MNAYLGGDPSGLESAGFRHALVESGQAVTHFEACALSLEAQGTKGRQVVECFRRADRRETEWGSADECPEPRILTRKARLATPRAISADATGRNRRRRLSRVQDYQQLSRIPRLLQAMMLDPAVSPYEGLFLFGWFSPRQIS